jgi:hypothetical protein
VSFWTVPGDCPFPREEDPAQTAWWDGLSPSYQQRWGPLLGRLDVKGRARFHQLRRAARADFRSPEGSRERTIEEDAAEERLYQRVSAGVARMGSQSERNRGSAEHRNPGAVEPGTPVPAAQGATPGTSPT